MSEGDSGKSTCETFWQCVLHICNGGIRSGSLGFPVRASSSTGYWQEFLVDWTFYLIVILILLNFVNGIIVDTFNELYEANLIKIETTYDTCIICNQKRSKFEVVGLDFEKHKFVDHYLFNYFYYIMRIKSENKHDLNAIDSQVLEAIEAHRTDFIPVKKSWDMMQIGDDEDNDGQSKKKTISEESKSESDEDDEDDEESKEEKEEKEPQKENNEKENNKVEVKINNDEENHSKHIKLDEEKSAIPQEPNQNSSEILGHNEGIKQMKKIDEIEESKEKEENHGNQQNEVKDHGEDKEYNDVNDDNEENEENEDNEDKEDNEDNEDNDDNEDNEDNEKI